MACEKCNDGIIVVCIDDMCRGAGECMHGDGEILCDCEFAADDNIDDYPEDQEWSE